MPNTRRRRFSVQNKTNTRDQFKLQNATLNSHKDSSSESSAQNNEAEKSTRPKYKTIPNSSRNTNIILEECEISNTSLLTNSTTRQNECNTDKNVTANSRNIDLPSSVTNNSFVPPSSNTIRDRDRDSDETVTMRDSQRLHRERTPLRRDNYLEQQRVKVRSPKRQTEIPNPTKRGTDDKYYQRTTGTAPIYWDDEMQQNVLLLDTKTSTTSNNNDDETRRSIHCLTFKSDLDDMCRICHSGEALSTELGPLISACSCRGTVGRVHVKCLEHWLTESGKSRCELCGTRYVTQRVHRYGVPRALIMWILSQNTKQLMVDSLGIMLMSPLAVLAAWLSGRTLAGLMSESHVTPWPLASTFVLACMTLVCYYCWIVSAASRHALGWWIWYKSQYEVRLQFQENQD